MYFHLSYSLQSCSSSEKQSLYKISDKSFQNFKIICFYLVANKTCVVYVIIYCFYKTSLKTSWKMCIMKKTVWISGIFSYQNSLNSTSHHFSGFWLRSTINLLPKNFLKYSVTESMLFV